MRLLGSSDVPRGTLSAALEAFLILGAAGAAAVVAGEVVHAAAALHARRVLAPIRSVPFDTGILARAGSDHRARPVAAVVVLGFANRRARTNTVNWWRARIALRTAQTFEHAGYSVTLVCCGGAVRGDEPEAEHLARAVRRLGWTGPVELDTTSRSTWKNIENALPFVADADRIVICSNGLHAEKAREYLRRQAPELAARLGPSRDYRPGERMLLKPLFAAVGLRKLAQLRVPRGTSTS